MCYDFKAFRNLCYIVNMRHPNNLVFFQAFEQWRCSVHFSRCFTEFTVVRRFNFATQCMRHKLHTIAHAKNRNTKFKNLFLNFWRVFFIHAVRTACEDDTLRFQFLNFFQRFVVWIYFAVYVIFTNTARDQLIILTTKVNNNYKFLVFHAFLHMHLFVKVYSLFFMPIHVCTGGAFFRAKR